MSKPRYMALVIVTTLLVGLTTHTARAAELVMFRAKACGWCHIWDKEVGVVYSATKEGKVAPLRQVDIHDKKPADLKNIKPVIFTPTFVLVDEGKEIGRITGYPGEDFFWGLLEQLIKKIPVEKIKKDQPV